MRKLIYIYAIMIAMIIAVSAVSAKEVANINVSAGDLVAGKDNAFEVSFNYPGTANNFTDASLIVKIKINSTDADFPVWKDDFSVSAKLLQEKLFFSRESALECFNGPEFNISYNETYYNETITSNGTFYCYDPSDYLKILKSSTNAKINFLITPKQDIYPGAYNIEVSLFELSLSDLSIFQKNRGKENCSELNSFCDGADINKDGKVDGEDEGVYRTHFGKRCYSYGSWCEGADINQDGVVMYSDDLEILKRYWKQNCSEENDFCENADINEDGIVDLVDLVSLTANYNRNYCNESNYWCDGSDINRDGAVSNSNDLKIMTKYWKQNCSEENDFCENADINEDGIVDLVDLVSLTAFYGKRCSSDSPWCNGADINQDGFVDGPLKSEIVAVPTSTGGGGGGSYSGNIVNNTIVQNNQTAPNNQTNSTEPEESSTIIERNPGVFSAITGAVVGALGKTGAWIAGIFIALLIALLIFVMLKRRKSKKSKK